MSGLGERLASAHRPVRNPIEHLREWNAWRAEEVARLLRITQERIRSFHPFELNGLPKTIGEFLRDFAHAQEFLTGDVDDERRRRSVGERLQAHGVGVALPNSVEIAHGKRDRFPGEDALRDIHEDAVTKFRGVVEANDGNRNVQSATEVLEDSLAAETTHSIFADRMERVRFA